MCRRNENVCFLFFLKNFQTMWGPCLGRFNISEQHVCACFVVLRRCTEFVFGINFPSY
jgi:hypothetical protein